MTTNSLIQRIVLAVALLTGFCAVAGAAPLVDPAGRLVDHGNSTYDTQSLRYWFDLSGSSGYSYDDMKAAGCNPTCTGGPFTGWTFAQARDVQELVEDAGLPYGVALGGPNDRLKLMIGLLGGSIFTDDTGCAGGCGGVHGLLDHLISGSELGGLYTGSVAQAFIENIACCGDFGASDSLVDPAPFYYYAAPAATSDKAAGVDAFHTGGVWLYRVPEPAPLALVGVALVAGTLGNRRKR